MKDVRLCPIASSHARMNLSRSAPVLNGNPKHLLTSCHLRLGEAVKRTWPSQWWFEPATRPPIKSMALCSAHGPKWKIKHAAALIQSGTVSLLTESDRYAPKSDLEGGKF